MDKVPDSASAPGSTSDRVLDALARLCLIVAGILLVFLIFSFGWLVFGRYVLNDTPTWIEQSSLLIVVYITCLGAAAGVRFNSHLSIDFLREGAPRVLRAIMHAIADGFVILFGAFMAWQGGLMVMSNAGRPIPMIGLSESWRAAPLVVCGVLLVIFTGANLIKRWFSNPRAGS
ncbi:TRAP transporter small permease [Salinicola acroporae]|uniref:TRAP transporter small permease protein n=1 Tax=Salinicola acroporae TaxID=1541440 RepID=A0ABT6I5F2_9GAMM|nr:TRAP transporter small permease [Salinicola acroporae]MDH4572766.1 TRAP transporter small permease [Salinicola acroporae]